MNAGAAPTGQREFPERLEVVDVAPPDADLCELQIVPEDQEGSIAVPTASYRLEGERLSFRQRLALWGVVIVIVAVYFLPCCRMTLFPSLCPIRINPDVICHSSGR